jgi:S-adenosylmethionine synthetase
MKIEVIDKNIFLMKSKTYKVNTFEIVERKGKGHPDTLADALAEEISRVYSKYTLSRFGAILHHNFDKLGLLGGESFVTFGEGYLTKPIRVLLNGRASICFGEEKIPVRELLEEVARNFLIKHFPNIDKEKDIKIQYNLSTSSSPGRVFRAGVEEEVRTHMFRPRGLHDLKELVFLGANDTSIGCSFAPLTPTEKIVLDVERYLNSKSYKKHNPWIGSDIKVLACRIGKNLDITICIPQIANYVPNLSEYINNLEHARENVLDFVKKLGFGLKVALHVNTKDNPERGNLYLTAIGSSIESGDEGLVGRGNRINGLITPCRPMAIEGACGKNPVYHVGKLYNIVAQEIAKKLYELTNTEVEVYVISQNGRALQDPWKVIVALKKNKINPKDIRTVIADELQRIPKIKYLLLKGKIPLC